MIFEGFSEDEKKQLIQYMLDNQPLDDAIKEVAIKDDLLKLVTVLVQNDKNSKGLILGILPESKEFAGTYKIFDEKHYDLTFVEDTEGKKFLMLFTSPKAFSKHPNLQGLLYFIKEVLQIALDKEEIYGVAFNIDSEYEILIDKLTIRAVISLLDKKEEK